MLADTYPTWVYVWWSVGIPAGFVLGCVVGCWIVNRWWD